MSSEMREELYHVIIDMSFAIRREITQNYRLVRSGSSTCDLKVLPLAEGRLLASST